MADAIRPTLPLYSLADEAVLRLLALTLARVERPSAALDELDEKASTDLGPYTIDLAVRLQRLRGGRPRLDRTQRGAWRTTSG